MKLYKDVVVEKEPNLPRGKNWVVKIPSNLMTRREMLSFRPLSVGMGHKKALIMKENLLNIEQFR